MPKIEETRHRRTINKAICGSVLMLLSFIPINANAYWVSESPNNQSSYYENYRDIAIDSFLGSGKICLAAEHLNGRRLSEKAGHIQQEASVCRI